MQQQSDDNFKRELGLLDGTMLVVGSMIGSGIFIVSADMVKQVGSAGWLIAIWILSSLLTIVAAVSYGELSAMFPKAGGQYVYLKEAYNKLIAFLYGWSFFAVIQTGTIAAVGVAFSKYTAYLIPAVSDENVLFSVSGFKLNAAQIVSIIIIVFLTYLNSRGVKDGKILQTFLTIIKVVSILGLIIFGFYAAKGDVWSQNWTNAWSQSHFDMKSKDWLPISGFAFFGAAASAMVGAAFSSVAWEGVTFIAGEIRNPKRNVGLSLFLGTLIVGIVYVTVNLMYLSVVPLQEIGLAKSERVAVVASDYIFGEIGTYIIAVMIMVSTFACNNGLIMAGARVLYTMGQDGVFFKKAAQLNASGVPSWALWAQCFWASALCLTGRYGDLLDFVVIIVIIFYILTIAGIFILRKKMPNHERPYRAFGYPIIPFLYIVLSSIFAIALLYFKTNTCGYGVLIMVIGIPIYYVINKKEK
jgi:basic amino acid/polyamine antiporter, APA family